MPTLRGKFVTLEPMRMEWCDELFGATAAGTFAYFPSGPADPSVESFRVFVGGMLAEHTRWMFAVRDARGDMVGSTSYMDMRPQHRGLEVGTTWYGRSSQGTLVNPECKLLLLGHAFGVLACERVQLKCDDRNERSKRAIAKLGARFEGVLRKHMVMPDGYVRDTAMFSVVAGEWAGVRAGLEARLLAGQ